MNKKTIWDRVEIYRQFAMQVYREANYPACIDTWKVADAFTDIHIKTGEDGQLGAWAYPILGGSSITDRFYIQLI